MHRIPSSFILVLYPHVYFQEITDIFTPICDLTYLCTQHVRTLVNKLDIEAQELGILTKNSDSKPIIYTIREMPSKNEGGIDFSTRDLNAEIDRKIGEITKQNSIHVCNTKWVFVQIDSAI